MAGGKEAEVDRMVVRLIGDASSYQKMVKEAQSVTKQVAQAIDTASSKSEKVAAKQQEAINETVRTLRDEAATYGMSRKEIALYYAAQQKATAGERATIAALHDEIGARRSADEAIKKQTEEVTRQKRSAEAAARKQQELIEETVRDLRDEAAMYGMTRKEIALYKATQQGATQAQKEHIAALHNQIAALNKTRFSAKEFGESMAKVGRTLMFRVTLPIIGLGTAAIKLGSDFESGFAGVKKTVNASTTELAGLRKGFQELLGEIPATQKELLGIGEAAGQLGIRTDKILDFTKTIAMIGVTTNLSTEEGASSMAKFANITQMSQDQFSNLGSSIVALGNNFATTERDIMSMSMRIAGAGSTVGMTAPQITALATALSSVGIEAEMGGSAISHTMLDIAKAVAIGGEDLEKFAMVSGMTAKDFAESWRKDASQGLLTFIQGLNAMDPEKKILALEELGVESVRMTDTLLRSSNAVEVLSRALDISQTAFKENTALANEAKQRYETFASQVTILKNRIGLLLSEGFEIMRPLLISVGEGITNLTEWFRGLSKETKTVVITVLALTASIGPTIFIMGKLLSIMGLITVAAKGWMIFKGLSTVLLSFTTTLGAGSLALGAFKLGLIGASVAITAGLLKALMDITMQTDKYNTSLEKGKSLALEMKNLNDSKLASTIADASATENLADRERILTEELEMAKKNVLGLNNQFNHLTKDVEGKQGKFWKNWSDNIELEVLNEELSEVKGNFDAAKDRVRTLQEAIEAVKKEQGGETKAKLAQREQVDLAAETERINKEKERAKAIQDTIDTLKDEANTYGMAEKEILRYQLAKEGATEEAIREALAVQEVLDVSKKQTDDAKKAKEEEEQKQETIKDTIKRLREQKETFGLNSQQLDVYRLKQMGASEEQIKTAQTLADAVAGLEKEKEAKDKAKKATDDAREAEKRFRDSFKTGGIEGVGRGLDALARLEESRMGRASTSKKTMEATILAETSGKGGGGKTAANPLANVAAFLNPEQQKMELLYLKLISEDTKRQADKETITLKPAGLGRSGS